MEITPADVCTPQHRLKMTAKVITFMWSSTGLHTSAEIVGGVKSSHA